MYLELLDSCSLLMPNYLFLQLLAHNYIFFIIVAIQNIMSGNTTSNIPEMNNFWKNSN